MVTQSYLVVFHELFPQVSREVLHSAELVDQVFFDVFFQVFLCQLDCLSLSRNC